MSRDASVTIAWADDDYRFRLGIGQLRELQEKCDAGPQWILERIASNLHSGWRADDVRETIRLGLIGGGLEPAKALVLVKRYVDGRPLAESLLTAQGILLAAIIGVADEDKDRKKAEAANPTDSNRSSEESSDLPRSTDGDQPLDFPPLKLTA